MHTIINTSLYRCVLLIKIKKKKLTAKNFLLFIRYKLLWLIIKKQLSNALS